MANLQVRNSEHFSSVTRQKAMEDAKKMQASVQDECVKAGKEVPPYLLQELIGKGSFGRVYKATDLNTKALVAVKIIDIEESDTLNPKLADTYSEFMKEISALKILSDSGARNINLILDALPVGQAMWMVTEYCAGGSVATLMKPTAPGGLQEKWIIPILREVAEAVYWVHKEGIIHRDIKCANVLVTESGAVQLCDFGVAGIVETKLDKRSTFIGTPHWMAPELFDPVPSYSTPVDIWAFGSLVYEIASGLPPNVMQGFNIPQLGNYIKHHAPRLDGDQYSDEIKDLVAFCLVEDPAKRPTVEQVQRHRYIANTEATHPTSNLANLVKAYKLWEGQGGIRKSLFAPVGAQGPSDYTSTALANDEWNFSTTVDFDQQLMNTDAQAVYDVYGTNVDFDFNEQFAPPPKQKGRRRLPPQLQPAVKAPLEKLFDPNTISGYEENSRAYYGRPPPPPTSTSDLPLRDDSLHSTLRESLIDLDMSFDGDDLSQFVDIETNMETIRAGMRAPSESDFEENTLTAADSNSDFNKPPRSDPADFNPNRRTQDWKFPSMAAPASATTEMFRFPAINEDRPAPLAPTPAADRPPLIHHQTDPSGMHSEPYVELMNPSQFQDNRTSVGSLIDLDESLAMPEYTRPSTANSDVASMAGSDIGAFDLERHASLYQPFQNNNSNGSFGGGGGGGSGIREPSIYISDDTDFARLSLASAPEDQIVIPDFSTPPQSSINGGSRSQSRANSRAHSRADSYDEDGYSAHEYADSEYLTMMGGPTGGSGRRSRAQSNASVQLQLPRMLGMNGGMNGEHRTGGERMMNGMNGGMHGAIGMGGMAGEMPAVPGPPSARVMQGMASREETREDVMRLLSSFSEHLSFANIHVSALPVRAGRRGSETYAPS
ncbi:putative serine/threonine-protein kinase [Triangularia verruculosa]|uniref:non-specific serine/threonine protein kinase n=1 Tax=Triangularia verruculosa TaxID=2587418 RepID=A0AAN6XCA0_9PEZI|nr:putative serine/threonine-protein kinase [Triangularia verruculosa]